MIEERQCVLWWMCSVTQNIETMFLCKVVSIVYMYLCLAARIAFTLGTIEAGSAEFDGFVL